MGKLQDYPQERITARITPIILSGGKSSRMKENKSFVQIAGLPMIEIIVQKLTKFFERKPLLITNTPEEYAYLGLAMVSDRFRDSGPLGGIHAGLIASETPYNFVFACDMPFLAENLIRYMVASLEDGDIILPRTKNGIEPLHAIYARSCIAPIEERLQQGDYRVRSFFSMVKVRYIEQAEIEKLCTLEPCFMNVNTPQELAEARKQWQGKSQANL